MNKTKEIKAPCRKINASDREESNPVDANRFKSLLGSLLYISVKTRPDIAYAVNQASRHSEDPREVDFKALLMILQYLKCTKDKSIEYKKSSTFTGYSDSDFAGDEETKKSTSGYIYLLGNSPISWKSSLQKIVTLSSAEAEYVSLTDCATKGIWFKQLFKEIFNKEINIKIYVDNQPCIQIAKNGSIKGRCKHIDTRLKYIREKIVNNKLKIEYIETSKMLADALTKSLPGVLIKKFNDQIFS